MPSSSPDNPFAEFAEPKASAVEYLEARRDEERKGRKQRWIVFGVLNLAASLAASVAAAVAAGSEVLALALALGFCGAVAGVLAGWLVAALAWSGVWWRSKAVLKDIGADLVRGDSWDRMTVWYTGWAALGIVCGAGLGATKGTVLSVRLAEARKHGATTYEVVGPLDKLAKASGLGQEEGKKFVLTVAGIKEQHSQGELIQASIREADEIRRIYWVDATADRVLPASLGAAVAGTLLALLALVALQRRRAADPPGQG